MDHKDNKDKINTARKETDGRLSWEEVRTEHLVQDEWMDFRRSVYRFPDGTEYGPYYSYSRRDYVIIVASDEEGRFLCVRQFRHGIKAVTTEFPAGGVERSTAVEYAAGDADTSTAEGALETARRELLEETGYDADTWTHLLTIPANATIADNYAHLFLAQGCRRVGGQQLDQTEFLDVEKHSAREIDGMIEAGQFQQAMHVLAWLLAKEAGKK